jgi:hypothetical protein
MYGIMGFFGKSRTASSPGNYAAETYSFSSSKFGLYKTIRKRFKHETQWLFIRAEPAYASKHQLSEVFIIHLHNHLLLGYPTMVPRMPLET